MYDSIEMTNAVYLFGHFLCFSNRPEVSDNDRFRSRKSTPRVVRAIDITCMKDYFMATRHQQFSRHHAQACRRS
jgi:hypothetical protein